VFDWLEVEVLSTACNNAAASIVSFSLLGAWFLLGVNRKTASLFMTGLT